VKQWYVLRSKPRKEQSLYQVVLSEGVECFYPQIWIKPANPRSSTIRSYFPGYMFVHVDLDDRGRNFFRWMPFSLGLVKFDGEPALVPENLVVGLKQRLDALNGRKNHQFEGLKPGVGLKITDGPFEGYEAICDARLSGQDRVRVLLKLLDDTKRLPLELNIGQVSLKTQA
jgi:transcriptional antiterminator RfaH